MWNSSRKRRIPSGRPSDSVNGLVVVAERDDGDASFVDEANHLDVRHVEVLVFVDEEEIEFDALGSVFFQCESRRVRQF